MVRFQEEERASENSPIWTHRPRTSQQPETRLESPAFSAAKPQAFRWNAVPYSSE